MTFASDDLVGLSGTKFAVARRHIIDFAVVHRNGLTDHAAPAPFESTSDHASVRTGRAWPQNKGVFESFCNGIMQKTFLEVRFAHF